LKWVLYIYLFSVGAHEIGYNLYVLMNLVNEDLSIPIHNIEHWMDDLNYNNVMINYYNMCADFG